MECCWNSTRRGGVSAEENSSRNAIKRVEVESSSTFYKMSLKFDPKDDTALAIESNDRDLAYLLFSDIREYLNSEVCKFRSFTFDAVLSSKNVFPFLMLPIMLVSLFSIKDSPTAEVAKNALANPDISAKLNFLIESRVTSQETSTLKYYMFAMFGVLISIFFLGSLLDKLFPRNVFYWGKAAQAFDKMLGARDKIVWGVVIAFVIGIASAIAYDQLKLPWAKTPVAVHKNNREQSGSDSN